MKHGLLVLALALSCIAPANASVLTKVKAASVKVVAVVKKDAVKVEKWAVQEAKKLPGEIIDAVLIIKLVPIALLLLIA